MEKYAEVLLTGPPPGPDGPPPGSGEAAGIGWLPPAFGSLADDIAAAVMSEVEEYAQPGDEEAARAVRRVARDAVAGFAARLGRPGGFTGGFTGRGAAGDGLGGRHVPRPRQAARGGGA